MCNVHIAFSVSQRLNSSYICLFRRSRRHVGFVSHCGCSSTWNSAIFVAFCLHRFSLLLWWQNTAKRRKKTAKILFRTQCMEKLIFTLEMRTVWMANMSVICFHFFLFYSIFRLRFVCGTVVQHSLGDLIVRVSNYLPGVRHSQVFYFTRILGRCYWQRMQM